MSVLAGEGGPPTLAPSGEKGLILIVEDNPTNARLTADMLHAAGFTTALAGDGESGLLFARQQQPDLVLTDLQMPGMDGLALTRCLKADPTTATIPVIAVTAHAMNDHREAAMLAGCCGFITKPFRYRPFIAEVFDVLRLHRGC